MARRTGSLTDLSDLSDALSFLGDAASCPSDDSDPSLGQPSSTRPTCFAMRQHEQQRPWCALSLAQRHLPLCNVQLKDSSCTTSGRCRWSCGLSSARTSNPRSAATAPSARHAAEPVHYTLPAVALALPAVGVSSSCHIISACCAGWRV